VVKHPTVHRSACKCCFGYRQLASCETSGGSCAGLHLRNPSHEFRQPRDNSKCKQHREATGRMDWCTSTLAASDPYDRPAKIAFHHQHLKQNSTKSTTLSISTCTSHIHGTGSRSQGSELKLSCSCDSSYNYHHYSTAPLKPSDKHNSQTASGIYLGDRMQPGK
jgi:hypothetical protein